MDRYPEIRWIIADAGASASPFSLHNAASSDLAYRQSPAHPGGVSHATPLHLIPRHGASDHWYQLWVNGSAIFQSQQTAVFWDNAIGFGSLNQKTPGKFSSASGLVTAPFLRPCSDSSIHFLIANG